jgi:hypothetical protein
LGIVFDAMNSQGLVDRAFHAFAEDLGHHPALSLRGGNDVDGYARPQPFDAERDQPTDTYLEQFAFWGLGYLDAASWRHYLPRLIDYALRHPDDPNMVVEALVRTLRPPDRYPPRLRSLTADQEAVVTAFLEKVALGSACPECQEEAQQALEEWWHPDPRARPSIDEVEAARRVAIEYREVGNRGYHLTMPESLVGSAEKDIPQESRRVATWGGYICGDADTMVAVNVTPLSACSFAEAVRSRSRLFRDAPDRRDLDVTGARAAVRLDGNVDWTSPAEPQQLTMVLAASLTDIIAVSIRAWPRDDVRAEVERMVASIRIVDE